MYSGLRRRYADRRVVVGLVVALTVLATVVAGVITSSRSGQALAETTGPAPESAPVVACPTVADQLPDVPDAALDEVLRDLDALQAQIGEANRRLATSQGEGGPDFVDNAVLGPLAARRVATLERIEIAIGRHADRPDLQDLAICGLAEDAADDADAGGDPGAGDDADAGDGDTDQPGDGAGGDNAGGGVGDDQEGAGDEGAGPAPVVNCPSVVDQLPAVPAAASEEVARDLSALESQIGAANERLATSLGEGGPDFVDNAVLGPLAARRVATLERIEIAIGRHADRPDLQSLAECTVQNP